MSVMKNCRIVEQRVKRYIDEESLFTPAEELLVALSGGADSVALLHLLRRLGYRCRAAHCNFHLRGEESVRDELFVRDLCRTWEVPLYVTHFDTREYASAHGHSVEMAARELRYTWFEDLCRENGLAHIAVAHHRDDSVETMLLNLIRGTGISGLTGIRPQNGKVVRPLLTLSRQDILEYLTVIGQEYVTDSTNLQDEYVRNKIRLRLLPLMEEINPSVKESMAATAARLRGVERVYDEAMAQAAVRVTDAGGREIHIPSLLSEKEPAALLFELLHPYGFVASQIDDMLNCLNGESGRRFVNRQWEVLKDREKLIIRQREEVDGEEGYLIAGAPAETHLCDGRTITVEILSRTSDYQVARSPQIASLDASMVEWPLTVRRWRYGDKFSPFGMKGKKLVSDYLTDCKLSLFEKERQWIVCDARDRILWVVGRRGDERSRVTDETTEIIELKLKEDSINQPHT